MAGVGQAGHLRLSAQRLAGRTRLTGLDCRPPLQAMRAHYLDPALPGMAFVTVMSPSGGVLQGDHLELVVEVGEGAQLHLDTASATRVYRMPDAEARQWTRISAAPGSLLELVPDPYLPYAGSRFFQEGCHEVAETATLILGEVIGPGRQARGERLDYERFASRLEVRRPGGELVFRDCCELEPRSCLGRRGMLGGWAALGSLYVVSQGLSADVLAATLDEGDARAGCSELPGAAGAWLRVLAPDTETAASAVRAAWRAARVAITGAPPPASRRI